MIKLRNFFPSRNRITAHILTGFDIEKHPGGIETVTRYLTNLLKEQGYEVTCYFAEDYENSFNLHNSWLGKVYELGQQFSSKILPKKDIVILNGYYGGGYLGSHKNTYAWFHSVHPAYAEALKDHLSKQEYWELRHIVGDVFERNALKSAKKIIAVSEIVKEQLIRYYDINPDCIYVIENPVDTSVFYPFHQDFIKALKEKFLIDKNKLTALFVGRIEKGKGIKFLLEFIDTYKEIFFIIVEAEESDILDRFENVRIMRKVDHSTLAQVYNMVDFLFFPSLYEGFGLAILEAISCGCPVISYEVGLLKKQKFRKFLENNSFFLDLKQIEKNLDNKRAILKLLKDYKNKSLNKRLNVHNFVKKEYSLPVWFKKWESVLK